VSPGMTASAYLALLQEQVDSQRTDTFKWPLSRAEIIGRLEKHYFTEDLPPDFMSAHSLTAEMVREVRARFLQQLAEVELPSRFEDPWSYLQIEEQDTLIREIIGESCPVVAFGTLPLGRINAASISVPDSDDFVVVVEQGLVYFAKHAAATAVQGLPSQLDAGELRFIVDLDAIERHVDDNEAAFRSFSELVSAYLFTGDPAASKVPRLSEDISLIAATLEQSILRFVLAHEYGHILAGHCRRIEGLTIEPHGVVLDEIDYSWEEELEADEKGMTWTLSAGARQQEFSILTFAGIDLFLSFHAILEKAAVIVRFGETKTTGTKTHPPSESRRARLRDILRTRLLFQTISRQGHLVFDDPVGAQLIEMAQAMEVMFERWFKRLVPELEEAHRSGRSLAPLWYDVTHIEKTWSSEPPSVYRAVQDLVKNLIQNISISTTKKDIDEAFKHFQSEMTFRYTGNPRREQLIAEADRKQEELDREYARKMVEQIFGPKE
jgi:hypothetical protein